MSNELSRTIDFEEKLKEKLSKELEYNYSNLNGDELVEHIVSAYSEGLKVFYEEGVKPSFVQYVQATEKNIRALVGIMDSQRETIRNLNKKIQSQEERISKLEEEIKLILKNK